MKYIIINNLKAFKLKFIYYKKQLKEQNIKLISLYIYIKHNI